MGVVSVRPKLTEDRALDGAMVRGIGLVGVYVAIASALRLAQDAAIAWRFGAGATVDAYYFLLNLGAWPVAVALSCLPLLIAPLDARMRTNGQAAVTRFRGELLGSVLVLAVLSLPVAMWLMHAAAESRLGGLSSGAAARASAGATSFAAVVPIGLVGALMSAWLVSSGRHVLALLEGLPSLALLLLVLLVPGSVLFWGASAAAAVQVVAMSVLLWRSGDLPLPRLSRSSLHWEGFSRGALLLLGAQIVFGLVPLIDTLFAARLGEGTVAAMGYTNRLVLGLQGLAGLGLQRSGLHLFSSLAVHSPARTRRVAFRWAMAMGGIGMIGGLLVACLAGILVPVLFQRGSFTAADAAFCATLLRYGMLQMPAFLVTLALVTALASIGAREVVALIFFVELCVKLLASIVLVPMWGAPGLMLATAVMYVVAAVLALIAVRQRAQAAESL